MRHETITLNSGALKNIAPWSAEEPTLYELTVLVVGHDGPLVEKITCSVSASAHSVSKTAS